MDDSIRTASNDVLEHEVTTLAGQIAAATCRFLVVIGELDRREAWGQWDGCKSMAHWLAWRCSMSPKTAYEHVRVARALRDLPLTTAAFSAGELSYSKVRVFTRIATGENEAGLIDLARTATAAQLERIVRASVVAAADPATREAMRELYMDVDEDGFGTIRGRGPIDARGIVETAITAALPAAEESPAGDKLAQRRWDALVRICESYLAHGDHARSPGGRNNAVVHVTVDEHGVVEATTDAGHPVHPSAARRILCDSSVQGMLGDMNGPIGCGRQTQSISRKLRRALDRRSGGRCEWPGCNDQAYLEGHHVRHWTDGGPTELWNLVHLCWFHHHLVHEGGWRILHDGKGGLRCFRPDGTELQVPVPLPATGEIAFGVRNEAIVPLWAGETFDLGSCVDAVLSASS